MRYSRLLLILAALSLGFSAVSLSSPADKKSNKSSKSSKSGDRSQHYKEWLSEDVAYIISPDEKKVFQELKNDEERESFIEDFWKRRNPDSRSGGYNVFKEEHYRRIAYANEHFASGIPGWKTDRGRIYIMYGKPDELESHPTGGFYVRTSGEGGGTTNTYPFEKWWYRHIEGKGDDIEIEFVDQSQGGEYRIAMSADEKDALLHVPDVGLTWNEEQGITKKEDRAGLNPTYWNDYNNPGAAALRSKDTPFSRMEQYFNLQRPPEIKFDDLKAIVTTHVSFSNLPYYVRTDHMKLSSDKALVPITLEINNKELQFKKEQGLNRAVVNVYGVVTGLNNSIKAEFEEEIEIVYADEEFARGKNNRSEYQKIVALVPGQRYKIDLVVKDVNSKTIGAKSVGINIPKYDDSTLQLSTIILANTISQAPVSASQLDEYVIGDLKILPNVRNEYQEGQDLKSYVQVYNAAIDQTSMKPSMDVTYTVKKDGKVMETFQDNSGKGIQLFSGIRTVILKMIPLKGLPAGSYTLELEINDNIANRKASTSTNFVIKESAPAISAVNP
jgi:GWxTD domain-containing protein